MQLRCLALAICIALTLVPSTHATVLANWDLDELSRRADLVVIGTVERKTTLRLHEQLFTDSRVRVEQVLKGRAQATLVVRQLGGRMGTRELLVGGDARLETGQRVLLFTRRHVDGRRYLVGMALGAYLVHGQQLVQTVQAPLLDDDGVVHAAPGQRSIDIGLVRDAIARVAP